MSKHPEKIISSLKDEECALRYQRLQQALGDHDGNMTKAAKSLGVSLATAYRIRSDGQRLKEVEVSAQ